MWKNRCIGVQWSKASRVQTSKSTQLINIMTTFRSWFGVKMAVSDEDWAIVPRTHIVVRRDKLLEDTGGNFGDSSSRKWLVLGILGCACLPRIYPHWK